MKKKNKKIEIPPKVINQIHNDIEGNQLRIYRIDEVPDIFIENNIIHPDVLKKSSSLIVAASGCVDDGRNYIVVAPERLDIDNNNYVSDLDPIVMVSDLETYQAYPSGVVHFHGDFDGRTEFVEFNFEPFNETVERIQTTIQGKIIPIEDAPVKFINAIHYMADLYKDEYD